MNESRTGGTTIWMVRHGESTWNVQGRVQGQADGPLLTEEGHRQSEAVAAQFRDRTIGKIYSSDLERARQTAAHLGAELGLPVTHDRALRERCFGVREGLPLSALDAAASGIEGDRVVDATARPDGGESLDEVYERVGAFLEWVDSQNHDGDVLLVSHGGAIRAMRAYCAGTPMSGSAWDVVANSSVSRVQRRPIVQLSK
jgi:2,3-bisphosphoglycerate-dependent phosphoglycerate mutase